MEKTLQLMHDTMNDLILIDSNCILLEKEISKSAAEYPDFAKTCLEKIDRIKNAKKRLQSNLDKYYLENKK